MTDKEKLAMILPHSPNSLEDILANYLQLHGKELGTKRIIRIIKLFLAKLEK